MTVEPPRINGSFMGGYNKKRVRSVTPPAPSMIIPETTPNIEERCLRNVTSSSQGKRRKKEHRLQVKLLNRQLKYARTEHKEKMKILLMQQDYLATLLQGSEKRTEEKIGANDPLL